MRHPALMKYTVLIAIAFMIVGSCPTIGHGQIVDPNQPVQEPAESRDAQSLDFDPGKVLDEVASFVDQHFFKQDFDGGEWAKKVAIARVLAVECKTHDEFSEIVNDLLATLKTSHTHYFSRQNPRRYQLLGVFDQLVPPEDEEQFLYDGVGIYTRKKDNSVFVSAVFDGLPADKAGIQFGDRIIDVDGRPFHPIDSFRGKAHVTFKFSRRVKEKNVEHQFIVPVETLDGRTMFETALKASQKVIDINGKKIGYVHVWSYAGSKYQDALKSAILWGDLSKCDSLVLDLREGWGGADVNYLNLFREPIVTVRSISRENDEGSYSGVWGKPVALITNAGSTSGKELFTFGFKKLKLGKVFGEKTAGAVVAGRAFLLSNQDVLYLAVRDVFVDGVRLEGHGVAPDFPVSRPLPPTRLSKPGPRSESDPQLDAAIKYLGRHR